MSREGELHPRIFDVFVADSSQFNEMIPGYFLLGGRIFIEIYFF